MHKFLMVGTGNGGTLDLYNTCFVIQNENGNFLIDTGGSIEIIKRLNHFKIDYRTLKHIFISHNHTDHLLGLIWLFKKIGLASMHGEIYGKIKIYCNDIVFESIKEISNLILPKNIVNEIFNIVVDFVILNNNDSHIVNGINYTFFDIKAKGTKQFGFSYNVNEKNIAFLGDETLNPLLYERFQNFDYIFHEAFCLDSEEHIFHAYEKNHSTTKSVSIVMNDLNIKNLILYHTEETHGNNRKSLYTSEAQKYFNGKIIVPEDFDIIEI